MLKLPREHDHDMKRGCLWLLLQALLGNIGTGFCGALWGPEQEQGSDTWAWLGCAGGMVEIFLFIIAAGVIAHFIGASVHEGIFVGALVRLATRPEPATSPCLLSLPLCSEHVAVCLYCHSWNKVSCVPTVSGCYLLQVSMSSTSIVVKCLHDSKATSSPHGQITIGTLILQARAARPPHCLVTWRFGDWCLCSCAVHLQEEMLMEVYVIFAVDIQRCIVLFVHAWVAPWQIISTS